MLKDYRVGESWPKAEGGCPGCAAGPCWLLEAARKARMGLGRGWGGVEDLEKPSVPTRVAAGVVGAHFGLWTWWCGASVGGSALCDVPVPQPREGFVT